MTSKAYLGSTNLDLIKIGSSDLRLYLGSELVYPIDESVAITFYDDSGNTYDVLCSSLVQAGRISYSDTESFQGTSYTSAVVGDCVRIIGGYSLPYQLTALTLSDSVEELEPNDSVPQNCVTLVCGTGLTTVGGYCMEYRTSIQSVTFNGSTPPTFNTNWEEDSNKTFTIYVPCDAIEAYRTALTGKTANLNDRLQCIPAAFKYKVKFINSSTGVETVVEVPDDGTTTITQGMIQSDLQALGYNYMTFSEIEFGDNITTIGSLAMLGTTRLSSVTLNNVTTLADHAFTVEENIPTSNQVTSLHIPASVTSIDSSALLDMPLTSITVDSGNAAYYAEGNSLISTGKTLVKGTTNSVIPTDVVTIGDQAFEYVSLSTAIEIPASVTSIGQYAFYLAYLPSNATPELPILGELTFIGRAAFASFNKRNVNTYILTPYTDPDAVTLQSATVGGNGLYGGDNAQYLYLVVADGTVELWQDKVDEADANATSKSNLDHIIEISEYNSL